ncbi:hypothetical protein AB1Y20_012113 [Prymnesium parvum]|uniref:Mitochondrial import inner membrane translocase subunit TIM22 n=1 Tax=Prymnesium parvum TaxID=97485 RepID=A0AB34IQA8_PRYPA
MSRAAQELPWPARVADGAFRGTCVGTLWVIWYGSSEAQSIASGSRALHMLRFAVLTPLGFATFFAAYNGVLCLAERSVRHEYLSPIVAGGTAGACMGALVVPFRVANVLGCAASTAFVCAAMQRLLH